MLKFIKHDRPVRIEFFKELDDKGRVKGYWQTPSNFHPEIKGGIPQLGLGLAQRFAGMAIGQIRKIGNLRLERWC